MDEKEAMKRDIELVKRVLRTKKVGEIMDCLDGPEQECYPLNENNKNTNTGHLPDRRKP